MNIYSVYKPFLFLFRKKRMRRFANVFCHSKETTILDVGGGVFNWRLINCQSSICILNTVLHDDRNNAPDNYSFVVADGTDLPFENNAFDIGYSNSVIEHVGDYNQQKKFADEIRRVGKNLWVQTPARCFFVEPHLITPFIHYLPKTWQRRLLRNFTAWGWFVRPSQKQVDELINGIRLLTYKEMKELFPDCEILRERFLGMTKSYIAVRKEHAELS